MKTNSITVVDFVFDDDDFLYDFQPVMSICDCSNETILRRLHEKPGFVQLLEGYIHRRDGKIYYCIEGGEEEEVDKNFIKQTFLRAFNEQIEIKSILLQISDEIRTVVDDGDERVKRVERDYWCGAGGWLIPIMKKELERATRDAQMIAKAEYKQERRLMGGR